MMIAFKLIKRLNLSDMIEHHSDVSMANSLQEFMV